LGDDAVFLDDAARRGSARGLWIVMRVILPRGVEVRQWVMM
jgi:hypothetical protein